jgi:hypothetical protein
MTRRAKQGYINDALLLTGVGFDRDKVLFSFVLPAAWGRRASTPRKSSGGNVECVRLDKIKKPVTPR